MEPISAPLTVLVVDDEAPARRRLLDLLRQDAAIGTLLEASDGRMAIAQIAAARPDLVFLDIQMPELSGLDVVAAVGAQLMPLTVFVTAYDQHALRAFEANALDYLLKPFSDERLEATLARAKARLGGERMAAFGAHLLRMMGTAPVGGASAGHAGGAAAGAGAVAGAPYLERLAIKTGGVTRLVRSADIDWIDGNGVYANLHVGGAVLLYRASLGELEAKLDPARFVRVHRSAILNVDSVISLASLTHGEFEALLKHGGRARVSRTYRAQLEQRLGQSL
jgi:two-component system LytT family response regulator